MLFLLHFWWRRSHGWPVHEPQGAPGLTVRVGRAVLSVIDCGWWSWSLDCPAAKWWRLGQFLFFAPTSDVWAALNGCCGFLAINGSTPPSSWARPSNTVFSIISKSCVNHLLVRSRIFKDVSGAVILLVSTVTCLWWRSSHERNRRLVFP